MADSGCRSEQDISQGFLNSTQTLTWDGPPLARERFGALEARMDEEHVATVGGSLWRLLRCRAENDAVTCSALGISMLTFGRPETTIGDGSLQRRWTVTGGWLARRGEVYGSITFHWRQEGDGAGQCRHVLSASVEGYPSRFLRARARPWAAIILHRVAALYTGYHRHVTCRFLQRIARWIRVHSGEGA